MQGWIVWEYMIGSGFLIQYKATDGVLRTPPSIGSSYLRVVTNTNNSNYGIQVGSGTTPVVVADYKLDTQIVHGTGAGQLSHADTLIAAPSVVGSTSQFVISRSLTNNSGGLVIIRELGLCCRTDSSPAFFTLLCRDLTGSDVDVLATQVAAVSITLSVTV